MTSFNSCVMITLAILLTVGGAALADEHVFPPVYRDLALGVSAAHMPSDGIQKYACGSRGGPPLAELDDWTGYKQCAPADFSRSRLFAASLLDSKQDGAIFDGTIMPDGTVAAGGPAK